MANKISILDIPIQKHQFFLKLQKSNVWSYVYFLCRKMLQKHMKFWIVHCICFHRFAIHKSFVITCYSSFLFFNAAQGIICALYTLCTKTWRGSCTNCSTMGIFLNYSVAFSCCSSILTVLIRVKQASLWQLYYVLLCTILYLHESTPSVKVIFFIFLCLAYIYIVCNVFDQNTTLMC